MFGNLLKVEEVKFRVLRQVPDDNKFVLRDMSKKISEKEWQTRDLGSAFTVLSIGKNSKAAVRHLRCAAKV